MPKDVIAPARQRSLEKIFSDLNRYASQPALDSVDEIDADSLKRAYGAIKLIAARFQIELDEPNSIEGENNDETH